MFPKEKQKNNYFDRKIKPSEVETSENLNYFA